MKRKRRPGNQKEPPMFLRSVLPALLFFGLAPPVAAQTLAGERDWAGAYGGVSFGAVSSDAEAVRGDFAGFIIDRDVENGLFPPRIGRGETSIVFGGLLGYTIRQGALVTGVEADLSRLDHDVRHDFSRIDPTPPPDMFASVETNTSYETEFGFLSTLRLRAGYALGPNLFYLTGGLAAGQVRNRLGLALPNLGDGYGNSWSASRVRLGYAAGAGYERSLSERMAARVEFIHFDLEDVTIRAQDPPVFLDNRLDYRFKNNGQILRAGVTVGF
jgi:outer membrane immunogenic protein